MGRFVLPWLVISEAPVCAANRRRRAPVLHLQPSPCRPSRL